ncbi:MAG: UDP-N-acetylmuramate-L-alanine ligase [Parcubacteria group bacterium GW2011_GWC1_45_13]|nr:MAG: UDP-N-acetylmuramate [Candidatus Giovannonibacteria bacterium GW2011_GWB1_44_23]KKT59108.1 MAG: UDP-N-acetylmuramate [Candidatus Giovannonibacteria bacterium GW2011_GWA1_44_25]KKT90869.1 MAG: UDP-N-acetylmuramate-L-alanine ligase [Parcubacteria group bacterium GW2011_GWC1_45_13]
MASLAGLLKQKGYEVAGSDQEMYEPMKSMLEKLKIKVFTPYSAFHMKHWRPNIVVVGNAIGRGNPELEYVLSNGHLYRSMSDILLDEFINPPAGGKKSIVITGTHGKTTTTALIAWILECAGLDPTVFVGGIAINFGSSFKLGKGKYVVLEGDEYDTAFFDKSPKFWHYRPFIGVVNNIELDHVDIYPNIEAYKYAFERFINLIPKNGLLVANRYDKNVTEVVKKFHPPRLAERSRGEAGMKLFGLKHGNYMAKNILAATAVARFVGVSHETVKKAVASFKGVKRRSEIMGVKHGITVIDDYAHHPTAVRETLDVLKQKFHMKPTSQISRRLFLMFEPGSASSKRRIFEKQYIEAFLHADVVYLYKPYKASLLKPDEVFHVKHVVSALRKKGIPAKSFDNLNKLLFHMKHDIRPNDVIVIMSCRGFDGLRERILGEI